MKIYAFFCTNIHSPSYFQCVTIMPHNFLSWILHAYNLFYEILDSYNNLFSSSEGVSKGSKHFHLYINKKETKQEFF